MTLKMSQKPASYLKHTNAQFHSKRK